MPSSIFYATVLLFYLCDARPPPQMGPAVTGCLTQVQASPTSRIPSETISYLARKADIVAKVKVIYFLDKFRYQAMVQILAVYKATVGLRLDVEDRIHLYGINSPLTCTRNQILYKRGKKGFVFVKRSKKTDELNVLNFGVQKVSKHAINRLYVWTAS